MLFGRGATWSKEVRNPLPTPRRSELAKSETLYTTHHCICGRINAIICLERLTYGRVGSGLGALSNVQLHILELPLINIQIAIARTVLQTLSFSLLLARNSFLMERIKSTHLSAWS
jgi:hypothetical protein